MVDLKVEKCDFAAQAQGFFKVTRLRRYIGICSLRVESCCYIGIGSAECLSRSSHLRQVSWKMHVLEVWILTFGESLLENARFQSFDSASPFLAVFSLYDLISLVSKFPTAV